MLGILTARGKVCVLILGDHWVLAHGEAPTLLDSVPSSLKGGLGRSKSGGQL